MHNSICLFVPNNLNITIRIHYYHAYYMYNGKRIGICMHVDFRSNKNITLWVSIFGIYLLLFFIYSIHLVVRIKNQYADTAAYISHFNFLPYFYWIILKTKENRHSVWDIIWFWVRNWIILYFYKDFFCRCNPMMVCSGGRSTKQS